MIESGIGLDFSTRYVKAASEHAAQIGIENISFIQGDAKAIPFKTGVFAMAYCFPRFMPFRKSKSQLPKFLEFLVLAAWQY